MRRVIRYGGVAIQMMMAALLLAATIRGREAGAEPGIDRASLDAIRRAGVLAERTGRWQALLEVGDAAAQAAATPELRREAIPLARRSYLAALLRARHTSDVEGLVRAAEAFAALGDRPVALQALVAARRLQRRVAVRDEVAARWRALEERLKAGDAPLVAAPPPPPFSSSDR